MSSFSPGVLNPLDAAGRDPQYGFLPFGSTDSSVIVQEALIDGIVDTGVVSEVGAGVLYNDGASFDGVSGLLVNLFDIDAGVTAALLDAGGQLTFEISKLYIDYYDVDDTWDYVNKQYLGNALPALEFILSWKDTSGTSGNRSHISCTTTGEIRVTAEGGTARNFRLPQIGFNESDEFVKVHMHWTSTTYHFYVDHMLLAEGDTQAWVNGAFNYLWIAMDRGNTSQKGMGSHQPNQYKIRNFQISTLTPTFASLPTGYLGYIGDSYANLAQDDYTGGIWNGNADTYHGRVGLQLGKILRRDFGIAFKPFIHGEGGHHVSNTTAPTLREDIGALLATSCYYWVWQASTNDAKRLEEQGVLATDYEESLKWWVEQIMSKPNTRGLVLSNACSLSGREDLNTPNGHDGVRIINAITAKMPAWWDSYAPSRRGRVVTCDLYTALGGEQAAKQNYFVGQIIGPNASGVLDPPSGQLGKTENDLHPSAKGYMVATRDAYWPALLGLIRRFG